MTDKTKGIQINRQKKKVCNTTQLIDMRRRKKQKNMINILICAKMKREKKRYTRNSVSEWAIICGKKTHRPSNIEEINILQRMFPPEP